MRGRIVKIARMGEKVLRRKVETVEVEEIKGKEIGELIEKMYSAMKGENSDGIGIAAPQIFVSKSVVMVENLLMGVPKTILFNPVYKECEWSGKIRVAESCLSVPGLIGDVERHAKVRVSYLDEKGGKRELEATGFCSAMFQHEIDHLNSTLFVDKVLPHTLSFLKEWESNIFPLHASLYCDEGQVTFLS